VSHLAILGYHRVGAPEADGWETWFYVPEEIFADQLRALEEGGWAVLGASELIRGLADPRSLPDRAALITFDDGHRCVLEIALPRLRELGLPAVMFMPSDFVGEVNEFDDGAEPPGRLCDWEQLRELAASGVSIHSHSASHRTFSELSETERRDEMVRSKASLEAGVGEPVELFAFPFGDGGDGGVRGLLAESGYVAGFGYGGDPFPASTADRYCLPRVAMGPDTDLRAVLAAAVADGS
jgi:peptidoglycan/xylan/chitin deacetylase (PgdA/CDA1 family)